MGSNIKIQSDVILVLLNVMMELSNVRKKRRKPLNVIKVLSNVMLVLPNVTMKPSNFREKKKKHQIWQKNNDM